MYVVVMCKHKKAQGVEFVINNNSCTDQLCVAVNGREMEGEKEEG